MSNNVYKFVDSDNLDKVLGADDKVTLKCSYPKDFNDPYELFLTISYKQKPEILAFYSDVVGQLPQLPTTCFSRSPTVLPMWAHYARNLQGFAIEFDEEKLGKYFKKSVFGDVDYQDAPDEDISDMLYRAYGIGKFRYFYLLRNYVFSAAYYTKATCWSYEQERRMLVEKSETRQVGDLMLLEVPVECVSALICGPRASLDTLNWVRNKAIQFGCKYFELKIGKSSAVPFFTDLEGNPYIFDGKNLERSFQFCAACKEPLYIDAERCSWCQIDESHKTSAAERNAYRMLDQQGMLEDYIKGMDEITYGEQNNTLEN
jgi:hypothetical protein